MKLIKRITSFGLEEHTYSYKGFRIEEGYYDEPECSHYIVDVYDKNNKMVWHKAFDYGALTEAKEWVDSL